MRNFSKYKKIYADHFNSECHVVEEQAKKGNFDLEKLALQLFQDSGLQLVRPKATGSGSRLYTPAQLNWVIKGALGLPKPLGPYVMTHKFTPVIRSYGFPIYIQGDIMMSMEKIRSLSPELAESAAEFLAHSLCLMVGGFLRGSALKNARETYKHLGVEYASGPLDKGSIEKLLHHGLVAESEVDGNMLKPDEEIKRLTREKLYQISEGVAGLICLSESEINQMVQDNRNPSLSDVKRILDSGELVEKYGGEMGYPSAGIELQTLAYAKDEDLRKTGEISGEKMLYYDRANTHFNYGLLKLSMGDKKGGQIEFRIAQRINPFDEGLDRDIKTVSRRYR